MLDRVLALILMLVAVVAGLLFLVVLVTKITVLSWISIRALAFFGAVASWSGLAARRLWRDSTDDRALERSAR